MNHLAIHLLVNEGDAAQAFERSEAALALDRRSPSIRSVRGAVLLVSGGTEEGKAEFEAAAQLRRDAPRLNNLAGIALASQDLELAQRNVAAALELHPDFAGGHATQGAVHLAQREPELAERELRTAEELDHDLPILPMLWANYYMGTGDLEQAAEKALEAVERRPHDWNTRLSAAQVLRAAGRFEDMRRQAHAVVEMVPEAQRAAIQELMLRPDVLGPTALEELEDDEGFEDEEGELGDLGGDGFRLESQTGLLDDEEGGGLPSGMGGPSLLGEEGPLLNPGDPSRLRLGGEGEGLRLDLSGE
jgi:tetratricopeptide (TPR) repeat protein